MGLEGEHRADAVGMDRAVAVDHADAGEHRGVAGAERLADGTGSQPRRRQIFFDIEAHVQPLTVEWRRIEKRLVERKNGNGEVWGNAEKE